MSTAEQAGPRPTMRDVAREAGVSKALVSIVFRGSVGASEESRRRVFAAADRLGYRPNRTASMLALRRNRQLGVVIDLHNWIHAEVVDAVLAAAERDRYQIVLTPWTPAHPEERAIVTALEFRCEGLLLVGSQLDEETIDSLVGGTPLVSIGRGLELDNADVVRCSDRAGIELVVDHLVGLGHRRIAHIDGGPGSISDDRRAGFDEGMRRHGLIDQAVVVRGGRTEDGGRSGAQRVLREAPGSTAVVAFNDSCAVGALECFTAAGRDVPGEISVTGYDDSALARLRAIDLTSVRQEADELGRWAVAAVIERLDQGRVRPRESVLVPRLVVRGSTAPVG